MIWTVQAMRISEDMMCNGVFGHACSTGSSILETRCFCHEHELSTSVGIVVLHKKSDIKGCMSLFLIFCHISLVVDGVFFTFIMMCVVTAETPRCVRGQSSKCMALMPAYVHAWVISEILIPVRFSFHCPHPRVSCLWYIQLLCELSIIQS